MPGSTPWCVTGPRWPPGARWRWPGIPSSRCPSWRDAWLADEPSARSEGYELQLPAALRRLGELHDARNHRAQALHYYGKLVDLWRDADPELQPLVRQFRQRMPELAGEPPR